MATQSTSLFILGLVLNAMSTILSTIALLLQKLSAEKEKGRPLWRRWRFWLSFTLNLGSEAVCTNLAIVLLPLSVLAPFAGLAVVTNAILAHAGCVPGVRERLGCVEWAATVLIMGSVSTVAVAGSARGEDADAFSTLSDAFRQPGFVAFACCSAFLLLSWVLLFEQRRIPCLLRYRPAENSRLAVVGSALGAALCGSFMQTCLKGASMAFFGWWAGDAAPPPVAWFWLIMIFCTLPLQYYMLQLMLLHGRATFATPIFMAFITITTSMSGGILFSEYEALLRREPAGVWVAVYIGAIILALVGLGVLSWQQDARAMESTRECKSIVPDHTAVEEPVAPKGDVEAAAKEACHAPCWQWLSRRWL